MLNISSARKLCYLFFHAFFAVSFQSVGTTPSFGFIENKGQIVDQFRHQNNKVLFLLNGKDLNVHLNRNGFSYEHTAYEKTINPKYDQNQIKFGDKALTAPIIKNHRIDIEFVNANIDYEIIKLELNESVIHVYNENTGENGVENIHHYNKIIYKNIYPNIDLEFLTGTNFKYNFILHPGANINAIQIRINGAIRSFINNSNDLEISTSLGEIRETIPLSYFLNSDQTKTETTIFFKQINGNTFGFKGNTLQKNQTLVIDPSPWGTYFGGSGYENGSSISTDSIGSVFVAGYTYSNSGIATSGSYQSTYNGNNDGFILKFNEIGNLLWATYYGGNNNDYCYDISTTKQGFIVIAGLTGSASGISSSGSYQNSLNGTIDAFLCKFNSNGTRLWASYFGGNNLDYGYGISSDINENIYLSGYTNSTANLSTTSAFQASLGGANDAMIAKFTPSGSLTWATYYGGVNNDFGSDILCDESGNVYFTGFSSSPLGIATTNTHQSTLAGTNSNDAFLVKLNPDGIRQWGTYFGGEANEDGRSISIDKAGNIYLAGTTFSSSGVATFGTFQTIYKGEIESFIASFDQSGARKWGTYIGGDGNDYLDDIEVDKQGNLVVVGFTYSNSGMASINAFQTALNGNVDAYIGKFDTIGNRIWATYYGGLLEDYANGLAINPSNYILVSGLTNSSSLIATLGSFQNTLAGTNDALILSLTGNGNVNPIINNIISSDQLVCPGEMPDTIIGAIVSGATGSFTYLWLRSAVGANVGFSPAPGINNLANYLPSASSNNYWLRRKVVSGGDFDTSNYVEIVIKPKPNTTFVTNNISQCVNQNSFVFRDNSSELDSIIKRQWIFGDGIIDSTNFGEISKTYTISGNYLVRLIRKNTFGCTDSFSSSILVQPKPIAAIFSDQFTTFCAGSSILVQSNLLPGNKITWLKNGNILSDSNKNILLINSGLYRSIQTNTLGCVDTSNEISVLVNPRPKAEIEGSITKYICGSDSVLMNSLDTNFTFYKWTKNGAILPLANTFELKTNQPGIYKLIIRNAFGCYDTSEINNLLGIQKPSSKTIIGKSNVLFSPLNLKVDTYYVTSQKTTYKQWFLNNFPILNGSDTFFKKWDIEGFYKLQLLEKTEEGCFGDTNFLKVNVSKLNSLEKYNISSFKIYPNPSNGLVEIDFENDVPEEILIHDIIGALAFRVENLNKKATLHLQWLPKGVYLITPISKFVVFKPVKVILE